MKTFKGNLIIQTMFMKGKYQGQDVDNTSDRYVLPWLETVKEIAPRQVMITPSTVKRPIMIWKRLLMRNWTE